ncbi:hypothetical protein [Mycolicibacterium chlorophenolicum]|uniref:hypothetical protein n=1 Tax=Mycolicibacterium chlorophenolicum TaxID=37916 RepID=UPI001F389A9B|nr:hypothetical protein [Mycolicibacterium chlorophenolicum]
MDLGICRRTARIPTATRARPGAVDADFRCFCREGGGDFGRFGHGCGASGGDDLHDFHAGQSCLHDAGLDPLHDLLDGAVCFCVDLVEVLAEAVDEACALLAHTCKREVPIGLAGVGGGVAVAFGAESVDRVAGLLGRDARGF